MTSAVDHVIRTLSGVWGRFLLAMLLCAWIGVGVAYVLGLTIPIAVGDVREADGVAVRGHSLNLRVTVTRFRFCSRTVERWMQHDTDETDPSTGKPIAEVVPIIYDAPGPPTPLHETVTYILTIPLPPDVTPGKWEYRSESHDSCGWFPFFDRTPRTSTTPVEIKP